MKEYPYYVPIITESTRATFFDYINSINISPIDYFSVGITTYARKEYTALTSRPEWQRYMVKNSTPNHDPVVKAVRLARRNIIPFSEIDYVDSFGKEIMRQRLLHGIKNGLVLIHHQGCIQYMLILATGFSKFHHLHFLKKHYNKFAKLKHDFTKIVEKDIRHFAMH